MKLAINWMPRSWSNIRLFDCFRREKTTTYYYLPFLIYNRAKERLFNNKLPNIIELIIKLFSTDSKSQELITFYSNFNQNNYNISCLLNHFSWLKRALLNSIAFLSLRKNHIQLFIPRGYAFASLNG